ncbi:MAG: hypothetical protein LC795_15225 [Acidobacteria bacterium]|nr:hypothetical protein [Acidobacteriota bacterium]MCA1620628.1 hypothetical protein [Acidobacteriota bacterium]
MIRASNIRLPGVYFLPTRRPPGAGLPRLDVAGFVGYAERGPLDWPVAVEDLDTYRAVFGGDLALARERDGRAVYANLPSAVASFFAQGGRRCHVVRVAGRGSTRTLFRLGGLVALKGRYEPGFPDADPTLATAYASSEGSWSEALRLGARLRATPLPLRLSSASPPEEVFRVLAPVFEGGVEKQRILWATGSAPEAVQAGDLLRLSFNGGRQFLFPVEEVRRPEESSATAAAKRVVLLTRNAWLLLAPQTLPFVVRVDRLTPERHGAVESPDGLERLFVTGALSAEGEEGSLDRNFLFKMTGPDAPKVAEGDVLRLKRIDGNTVLFPVTDVFVTKSAGGATQHQARAPHALYLPAQKVPETPPSSLIGVERLRFDLLLREGTDRRPTVEEMAFNRGHARFWGDVILSESSSLRRRVEGGESGAGARKGSAQGSQPATAAETAALFRAIRGDERVEPSRLARFDSAALAGLLSPVEGDGATFIPLGMLSVLDEQDIVGPLGGGGDDLGEFDPALFVDETLVPNLSVQPPTGDSLMAQAFDRYYIQDKRLRGLHSLTFVGEVALVSCPEAVQRAWPAKGEAPPEEPGPEEPGPEEPPDLSKFCCCEPAETHAHEAAPSFVPAPPDLSHLRRLALPYTARLNPNDETDQQYLDEQARIVGLHHALLNFCHARRDAFAVLALPSFYEKRHCVRWQEEFRARLGLPERRSVYTDARDVADLSYAGVYHPWLLVGDDASADRLRAVPPDGAACGLIAARERERQAWVAPANVALTGVLGLAPEVSTGDWADLFELQFNFVRREARDFRAMSAHTLSDEAIWLQISVRRLLILIRRFVVERGMDFVFESNHERFRRGVQLVLEDALLFMHGLGAFAGASPEQSFNVVTDASVNPPPSVDAGRFVAQIQVAPSQPTEFITVLLTRVAEDLLMAREG